MLLMKSSPVDIWRNSAAGDMMSDASFHWASQRRYESSTSFVIQTRNNAIIREKLTWIDGEIDRSIFWYSWIAYMKLVAFPCVPCTGDEACLFTVAFISLDTVRSWHDWRICCVLEGLVVDPAVLSVSEAGRQRNPPSVSSFRLHKGSRGRWWRGMLVHTAAA